MKSKILLGLSFLLISLSLSLGYFVQQVIAFESDFELNKAEAQSAQGKADLPVINGIQAQTVSFTTFTDSINKTGSKLVIRGWFFPGTKPSSPTLIALHGKGSNKSDIAKFTKIFSALGFNVLAYDQRHHGESDGSYTTYGHYESYDVSAAIDFLASKNINTKRLGIAGESFGAATSIMAAEIEPRIKFVIADSSYTSMSNAIKDNALRMNHLPHYPIPDMGFAIAALIADFNPWQVTPIESIKKLKQPTLIVHCDLDVWAYPKYAKELYEASDQSISQYKMYESCRHVQAYDMYTQDYTQLVENFLTKIFLSKTDNAHLNKALPRS